MSTFLHHPIQQVDVTAPLRWGQPDLLTRFDYVIEVEEYESTEFSADGRIVQVLGGWFCSVTRQLAEPGDYFPNEWEAEAFTLPGRLKNLFEFGELERMLDTAAAARDEFAGMGFSSVIVFRPGPHWLMRSRAKLRVAS